MHCFVICNRKQTAFVFQTFIEFQKYDNQMTLNISSEGTDITSEIMQSLRESG